MKTTKLLDGQYICESSYEKSMIETVEPYIDKLRESGYFIGNNNLKIYYESFILQEEKGSIVICHGFGEYIPRYNELIYYFLKSGYSVFIMEHRGCGRSGRLGCDSYQINVEKFEYYVDDFKIFIDDIVMKNEDKKNLLLFAHSMGGGIATKFLEEYPKYFKRAVLSAPMHGINTGKYHPLVASVVSKLYKIIGKRNSYLPGQKPYSGIRENPIGATSSSARYEYYYNKSCDNKCYRSGGSSANWYYEANSATKSIIKKKNASKVLIPVLLLQPQNDTYVILEAQNQFAKYAKQCKIVKIEDSKHESFHEVDTIAFKTIETILDFLGQN